VLADFINHACKNALKLEILGPPGFTVELGNGNSLSIPTLTDGRLLMTGFLDWLPVKARTEVMSTWVVLIEDQDSKGLVPQSSGFDIAHLGDAIVFLMFYCKDITHAELPKQYFVGIGGVLFAQCVAWFDDVARELVQHRLPKPLRGEHRRRRVDKRLITEFEDKQGHLGLLDNKSGNFIRKVKENMNRHQRAGLWKTYVIRYVCKIGDLFCGSKTRHLQVTRDNKCNVSVS
jgi:hypothetical protein